MPNSTQRNVSRNHWLACLICVGLVACGKSDDGTDPDAGSGATPGQSGTGGPSGGPAGTGSSGSKSTTKADGGVDEDEDGDGDPTTSAPEFEGMPTKEAPSAAPPGCTHAEGNTDDTLVLQLDAKTSMIILAGKEGVLQANGITCTSVKAPKHVKILGTAGADIIVVDFSIGELPASMTGGTISIDAAGAKDSVAIAATREIDDIHLGNKTAALIAMRIGDTLPTLTIANQEELIVSAGPGDDRIDATGGISLGGPLASELTAYGCAGSDVLVGGSASDSLHGGAGDDLFNTAAAADGGDTYDGGPGVSDTLSYELRSTPLNIRIDNIANDGAAGERDNVQTTIEVVIGGSAADTITGSDGDDTLIGGPGNDTLNGGDGDDMFIDSTLSLGSDIMNGGAGSDTVEYSERTGDITVTLCTSTPASCEAGACGCVANDGEGTEYDNLVNIENVWTGNGNDKLTGNAADNTFGSGGGVDELRGEGGDDTLYAGPGDDILFGGPGDDMLSGDGGNDMLDGGDDDGDICVSVGKPLAISSCEIF